MVCPAFDGPHLYGACISGMQKSATLLVSDKHGEASSDLVSTMDHSNSFWRTLLFVVFRDVV